MGEMVPDNANRRDCNLENVGNRAGRDVKECSLIFEKWLTILKKKKMVEWTKLLFDEQLESTLMSTGSVMQLLKHRGPLKLDFYFAGRRIWHCVHARALKAKLSATCCRLSPSPSQNASRILLPSLIKGWEYLQGTLGLSGNWNLSKAILKPKQVAENKSWTVLDNSPRSSSFSDQKRSPLKGQLKWLPIQLLKLSYSMSSAQQPC